MGDLQEFKMTEKEEQDLRSVADNNCYLVIKFWKDLGEKYRFDPNSVEPINGVGVMKFRAIPV